MANSKMYVEDVVEKVRFLEASIRELDGLILRFERLGDNAVPFLLAPYFDGFPNGRDPNNPFTQNDFYAMVEALKNFRAKLLLVQAGDPPTGLWGKTIFEHLNKVV